MENQLDEKEIKVSIEETEERMKQEKELLKSQRKSALTWNIIFFIGIIGTSIAVSIFTKLDTSNFEELFKNISSDKLNIWWAIIGTFSSFLVGIFGSYFKTKSLKSKTKFEIHEFVKETYFNRLDKSKLNPNR